MKYLANGKLIIKSNIENFNILQEEENKKSIDIEMTVTDDDDDIDNKKDEENTNLLNIKMTLTDDDNDEVPNLENDQDLENKIDDKVDEVYKDMKKYETIDRNNKKINRLEKKNR